MMRNWSTAASAWSTPSIITRSIVGTSSATRDMISPEEFESNHFTGRRWSLS